MRKTKLHTPAHPNPYKQRPAHKCRGQTLLTLLVTRRKYPPPIFQASHSLNANVLSTIEPIWRQKAYTHLNDLIACSFAEIR